MTKSLSLLLLLITVSVSAQAAVPVCPDLEHLHATILDKTVKEDGYLSAYSSHAQKLGTDIDWFVVVGNKHAKDMTDLQKTLSSMNTYVSAFPYPGDQEALGDVWSCEYYDSNYDALALAFTKRCGLTTCPLDKNTLKI